MPASLSDLETLLDSLGTSEKSVAVDGRSMTARDLQELIAFYRFKAGLSAAANGGPGIRVTQLVPKYDT